MKKLGIAALFFAMVFSIAAQTNPSLVATNMVAGGRMMSLQDCVQEALKHNLDVQIQRYNPEVSLYNLRASYGGYDPLFNVSGQHNYNVQPGSFTAQGIQLPAQTTRNNSGNAGISGVLPFTGLQYDLTGNLTEQHFLNSTNGVNSSGAAGISLTQPLLKNFWIDGTRLTIKLDKNKLQTAAQVFRGQVITSITQVENAYYNLIFNLENVKVQEEAVELAQTQLDQDRQRLQIGTLAQLSVQQDESLLAKNKATLITDESTLAGAQVTLKNLLTDNYSSWQNIDIQPTETLTAPLVLFNLEDSWNKALSERPDLLQSRLNVEAEGIQLKFDRNQLFPELDVIGTYGWNGAGVLYNGSLNQIGKGNAPYYSYGAQLSIPLANQSARNNYKAGKVTLQQAVLQLKQLEQKIMAQVDNDVATAQSNYENVDATRQARIYAEAALDAEQKTYAVGKATTFDVLQQQELLTQARLNEIQALANYEEALATLAQDEGSTLDRMGINLEVN